jgi:hypothetical protein
MQGQLAKRLVGLAVDSTPYCGYGAEVCGLYRREALKLSYPCTLCIWTKVDCDLGVTCEASDELRPGLNLHMLPFLGFLRSSILGEVTGVMYKVTSFPYVCKE